MQIEVILKSHYTLKRKNFIIKNLYSISIQKKKKLFLFNQINVILF